jgi:hypothetical protein
MYQTHRRIKMSDYAKLALLALENAAREDDLRRALDIALIFLPPQESGQ